MSSVYPVQTAAQSDLTAQSDLSAQPDLDLAAQSDLDLFIKGNNFVTSCLPL